MGNRELSAPVCHGIPNFDSQVRPKENVDVRRK
jgi:hypothetical protein